jgi:hypothetical protein
MTTIVCSGGALTVLFAEMGDCPSHWVAGWTEAASGEESLMTEMRGPRPQTASSEPSLIRPCRDYLQTATPLTRQAEEERQRVPLKETAQETTMDNQHNLDTHCVARARSLIARVVRGVEQLEDVASLALRRQIALGGMMGQIEEQLRSPDPDAVDAGLLSAARVCREAEILLRYLDSVQWNSVRIAVKASGQRS